MNERLDVCGVHEASTDFISEEPSVIDDIKGLVLHFGFEDQDEDAFQEALLTYVDGCFKSLLHNDRLVEVRKKLSLIERERAEYKARRLPISRRIRARVRLQTD